MEYCNAPDPVFNWQRLDTFCLAHSIYKHREIYIFRLFKPYAELKVELLPECDTCFKVVGNGYLRPEEIEALKKFWVQIEVVENLYLTLPKLN